MPIEITTQTRQMSGTSVGETRKNNNVVIEPNRAETQAYLDAFDQWRNVQQVMLSTARD